MSEKINIPMHIAKRLGYKPLNQNQKIVLEWMKEEYNGGSNIFESIGYLESIDFDNQDIFNAYDNLNSEQQFQLLAEFAKWGLGGV